MVGPREGRLRAGRAGGKRAQEKTHIDQAVGDDMDDQAFALEPAMDADQSGRQHDAPIAFEDSRPDDDIGHARLVLQRGEDNAAGRAGALAHQHHPRHAARSGR